jgi:hypothetical protein
MKSTDAINTIGSFLLARSKEPSTWAALGTILVTGGILSPEGHQRYLVIIGALCAIAGAGMVERGAPATTTIVPAAPVPTAIAPGEASGPS